MADSIRSPSISATNSVAEWLSRSVAPLCRYNSCYWRILRKQLSYKNPGQAGVFKCQQLSSMTPNKGRRRNSRRLVGRVLDLTNPRFHAGCILVRL